jgi:uncharacterized membrane protein YgcG
MCIFKEIYFAFRVLKFLILFNCGLNISLVASGYQGFEARSTPSNPLSNCIEEMYAASQGDGFGSDISIEAYCEKKINSESLNQNEQIQATNSGNQSGNNALATPYGEPEPKQNVPQPNNTAQGQAAMPAQNCNELWGNGFNCDTQKSIDAKSGTTANPTSTNASTTSASTTSQAAEQKAEQEKQAAEARKKTYDGNAGNQCTQAAAAVKSMCDPKSNKDVVMATTMANSIASQLTAASSTSIQNACSGVGTASQTMNGALTAFKSVCWYKMSACERACGESAQSAVTDPNIRSAMNEQNKTCDNALAIVNGVDQNILSLVATNMNASKCEELAASLRPNCNVNPFAPGCNNNVNNCNSPAAANNPICRCMSYPNDPMCSQFSGKLTRNSPTGVNNGANLAGYKDLLGSVDGTDFGLGEEAIKMQKADGSGGSRAPGGGGGRGVSASTEPGRGGNGSGGGNGGGGGGSGANSKVLAGYWGGGSGGGAWGGGGARGAASGGPNGAMSNGRGVAGGNQANVDLKKFLPGGAFDPRRRPANVVGPDGITGPMSDIFKKINDRYLAVGPSLKQR